LAQVWEEKKDVPAAIVHVASWLDLAGMAVSAERMARLSFGAVHCSIQKFGQSFSDSGVSWH
jgi:hypothetical protein